MNSQHLVEFYTPEGELRQYRPLSARLPAFLAVYGPAQGFSVQTEFADPLGLKPGLLRLYAQAVRAGRKPDEVGLPVLGEAAPTLVCRAVLRDPQGRTLATATAAKPIRAYKDVEILETAARQRLLAALGFGGEVFDEDEADDRHARGSTERPVAPAAPATVTPIPPPAAAAAANADATPSPSVPDGAVEKPVAPVQEDIALAGLRRQIAHQARLRGVEPPVAKTRAEAQVALRGLMRTP